MDLQEELVRIWQFHKVTVIFVTHSVEEALILGTKVAVMTRRPGRIRELMNIQLPRPRDITSHQFNEYKRNILGYIRDESKLAKAT
jgi:NitT/TauT family transport system ATP-binding protein